MNSCLLLFSGGGGLGVEVGVATKSLSCTSFSTEYIDITTKEAYLLLLTKDCGLPNDFWPLHRLQTGLMVALGPTIWIRPSDADHRH